MPRKTHQKESPNDTRPRRFDLQITLRWETEITHTSDYFGNPLNHPENTPTKKRERAQLLMPRVT